MTATFATYRNYARTSLAYAMPWRRDVEVSLEVKIDGGVHEGSLTTIDDHVFCIGPAATDNIMLLDKSIAGESVKIETETSLFGAMISVHTDRTDVCVNGAAIQGQNTLQTFRLPCTLQIGGVPIVLSQDHSSDSQAFRPIEIAAIVLLSWVCVFAIGYALNLVQTSSSSFSLIWYAELPLVWPSDRAQADHSVVTTMLQEAGLSDYLRVVPKSAEALAVTGTLPADLKGQWLSVRRQLDQSSERLVVFSEFDESPSRPTIPAIASVRFGDDPALIFSNNRSARVGDTLGGGWTLTEVRETGFGLTRQGKEISISY